MDAAARSLAKRRKFLRGIGEIVLGVLIALTLGAVATEIGWLIDVRNAKNAIAEELGEILGQGRERVRIYPCVERKLTAIGGILDEAAPEMRRMRRWAGVADLVAQCLGQHDRIRDGGAFRSGNARQYLRRL